MNDRKGVGDGVGNPFYHPSAFSLVWQGEYDLADVVYDIPVDNNQAIGVHGCTTQRACVLVLLAPADHTVEMEHVTTTQLEGGRTRELLHTDGAGFLLGLEHVEVELTDVLAVVVVLVLIETLLAGGLADGMAKGRRV